ncbi:hypothetical protein ACLOJK_016486 [Asimina triloba]
MLKAFPAIIFASKACHLEDRLTNVAMGKAFSFKAGTTLRASGNSMTTTSGTPFESFSRWVSFSCLADKCLSSSGNNGEAIRDAKVRPIGGEDRVKVTELQRGQHQWRCLRHGRLCCHVEGPFAFVDTGFGYGEWLHGEVVTAGTVILQLNSPILDRQDIKSYWLD